MSYIKRQFKKIIDGSTTNVFPVTVANEVLLSPTSQTKIDDIIPFQADSSNQLADKNFVITLVSEADAEFKGTFDSVEDLAEVTANRNDYAYVVTIVKNPEKTIFSMDFAAQETQQIPEGGFLGEVFFRSATTVTNGTGFEFLSDPSTSSRYIAIPLTGISEEIVVKVTFGANKKHSIEYQLVSGESIISPTIAPTMFEEGERLTENSTMYTLTIDDIPAQNNYGVLYLGRNGSDSKNFRSVIVKTLQASNVSYDKYKWTEDGWEFEYSIDRDGFSVEQWSAINSGIDSDKVTKLDGIESEAQVNIIEKVKVNNTELTPDDNKSVNVTVPTNVSAFTNDASYITLQDMSGKEDLSNKVTTLDASCTDTQYPSAKALYDIITSNELITAQALVDLKNTKVDSSSLATVATSGNYDDLTNKPSLFSGNYDDLTNKPTIPTVPTNISAFTNDASYITLQDISGKEDLSNKVIVLDASCTDTQYPSAKALYDIITNNELITAQAIIDLNDRLSAIETQLANIQS